MILAAAEGAEMLSPLATYGPLGIFAAIMAVALRWSQVKVIAVLQSRADAAEARADKAQAQLDKQNEIVQEKVIVALIQSNAASQRMLDFIQRAERP
jgi:threonine dehydrogenase-like Zn-dependent dehydrogenase